MSTDSGSGKLMTAYLCEDVIYYSDMMGSADIIQPCNTFKKWNKVRQLSSSDEA